MTLPSEDLRHILAKTGGLWEAVRGRRLFLTGATGFFGCWLLESLLAANDEYELGAEATVLTRDPDRFAKKAPHLASHPAVNLLQGDVAGFPFPAGDYSHIVHAATTSSAPVADAEQYQTIVDGTARVLDFAKACGARQLLFTSSGAVYGKQPPEVTHLPEDFAIDPLLTPPQPAYTLGKRTAEQLCLDAQRSGGLQTKIARCFAFVGPHLPLNAHFAIGNFIRDALRGAPIHIQGDGTPLRSYLYAADLAIWLWTILFRGESGRPYNVGSSQALSIRELAETVGRLFNVPGFVAKQADPAVPAARYVPNTTRAQTELGLEAWVALEDAIIRTARWHRDKNDAAMAGS